MSTVSVIAHLYLAAECWILQIVAVIVLELVALVNHRMLTAPVIVLRKYAGFLVTLSCLILKPFLLTLALLEWTALEP